MKNVALTIIITFISVILIGTILLSLPFTHSDGAFMSLHDSFFTATSAVTVTGLTVKDTSVYFNFFGQFIILILIQFGGLGFMTFSTFVLLLLGKSISIHNKMVVENNFTSGTYPSIKDLLKKIIFFTFLFEFGGFLLFFFNLQNLEIGDRIFSSVFHSVSAFCNAGFSIVANGFESYSGHIGINLTLIALIIFGGLGFIVLSELFLKIFKKNTKKLSLHSKLVLIISGILLLIGTVLFFITGLGENSQNTNFAQKIITSVFQSVTSRTAGFNTVNQAFLPHPALIITILLMFIGASPGSTGGGIKTSTIGMIFLHFKSKFQNKNQVQVFNRTIPGKSIEKAFIILIISITIISAAIILVSYVEPEISLKSLLFEVISAFGTVGLSMGITAKLSIISKIIISIVMFIGRIGPLTFLIALSKPEPKSKMQYAEEDIMIG